MERGEQEKGGIKGKGWRKEWEGGDKGGGRGENVWQSALLMNFTG